LVIGGSLLFDTVAAVFARGVRRLRERQGSNHKGQRNVGE
jgi:hypothetical protein